MYNDTKTAARAVASSTAVLTKAVAHETLSGMKVAADVVDRHAHAASDKAAALVADLRTAWAGFRSLRASRKQQG